MVLWTAAGLVGRGHRVDIVVFEPTVAYKTDIPRRARFEVLCRRRRWRRRKPDTLPGHAFWRSERMPVNRAARSIAELVVNYGPSCLSVLLQPRVLGCSRRLAHYLDSKKPDIILGNHGPTVFASLLGSRMTVATHARTPLVPIIHGFEGLGTSFARRRHLLVSEAAHFVAVSNSTAESFSSVCRVPEDKITTIHNSVDLNSISRQAEVEPNHPWFTDNGPPIILSAGRLVRGKGFCTLLNAFSILQKAEGSLRLLVLGEGPLRGMLEDRVRSLGLEGQVSLPGWVGNPFAHMSRSALFVLASRSEGFGMVLAEAMACGCPAVATDCPGPPEILQDPDLLAPVGDPDALAQVMLRVLNRPRNREEMRAKSAQFSVERCAAAYETLIARVLAEAKSQECKANRHSS